MKWPPGQTWLLSVCRKSLNYQNLRGGRDESRSPWRSVPSAVLDDRSPRVCDFLLPKIPLFSIGLICVNKCIDLAHTACPEKVNSRSSGRVQKHHFDTSTFIFRIATPDRSKRRTLFYYFLGSPRVGNNIEKKRLSVSLR